MNCEESNKQKSEAIANAKRVLSSGSSHCYQVKADDAEPITCEWLFSHESAIPCIF